MKSGIYKITAIHSGEFYIGSSNDINRRWAHHKYYLTVGKHSNPILQKIFKKHGKDCFCYEVIEYVDINNLIIKEQYYIDTLTPKLNIRLVAHSNQGLKHKKETIEKIRLLKTGLTHSDESKQKMREAHLGKKLSEEHKEKLRIINTGKVLPKKTEQQILNNARSQAKLTDEQVYQIKWLGWLGLSASEIARPFNIANTTVFKIIKGYKKAYNHVKFDPSVPTIC